MEFRTKVNIDKPNFLLEPCEEILFVGSCFADYIGKRFQEEKFHSIVNPYGVMYNPASVFHTIQRLEKIPRVVFLTLGTNRVYILSSTGEIVDNCQRRPQNLFTEKELSIKECLDYLSKSVLLLKEKRQDVNIVVTISPIRYAKYGFHGSALSKATLLLATEELLKLYKDRVSYFPAYEILNDELRDYRFYSSDMIHPSNQTVEYIWEELSKVYLSEEAKAFLQEWKPIKQALAHKPFNPESSEYKEFLKQTLEKQKALEKKYPNFTR